MSDTEMKDYDSQKSGSEAGEFGSDLDICMGSQGSESPGVPPSAPHPPPPTALHAESSRHRRVSGGRGDTSMAGSERTRTDHLEENQMTLTYLGPPEGYHDDTISAITALGIDDQDHWAALTSDVPGAVQYWVKSVLSMTEDQPEIEKHEKDIISATLQDVQFDHEGRPSTLPVDLGMVLQLSDVTWDAARDIISELTFDSLDGADYASEVGSLLDEDDGERKLRGMHRINNRAFDNSIPRKVQAILQRIQDDEGKSSDVSDFLRENLGRLFENDFVDLESALQHRREWAKLKVVGRVGYIRKLVRCMLKDPQESGGVTLREREALKRLEREQGWSGKKGKAAIPM